MDHRPWLIAGVLAIAYPHTSTHERPGFELAFEALEVRGGVLNSVSDIVFLPEPMQLLLLEKAGRVVHAEIGEDRIDILGSFRVPTFSKSDCGLVSGALAPDFETTGYLFLGRCLGPTDSAIERFVFDPSDYGGIAATAVETLRLGDWRARRPWHNVGDIGFDPDGNMWALFGDKTIGENAQRKASGLGKLLRFGVGADGKARGGVSGNPLLGRRGSRALVHAYGLRSPFKGVLDADGRFWIGDVGSDDHEEVDLVSEPGQNFGWPAHEGPCEGGCQGMTDPLVSWPHAASEYTAADHDDLPVPQRVVWVGTQYTGRGGDRYGGHLTGRVLLGDLCVGFIRSVAADPQGRVIADEPVGHLAHAAAWAEGPDGFLYTVQNAGCGERMVGTHDAVVYRVVPRADR